MRESKTVLCRLHSRSQPRYPRFTLCPDCHTEAPHEAIVVEAVVNHFSRPEFSKFCIQTEHKIQMGADSRRADIVLLDRSENFAAIAECKQTGIVTYGHEQLQSYLCATDTQFGVFANSTDPSNWKFYENLGRNRFKEITLSQFNAGVGITRPIELISSEKNGFKNIRTSRAWFARQREKAKRASQQNT